MVDIALVVRVEGCIFPDMTRQAAKMLTGEHDGSEWIIPEDCHVPLGSHVLVEYQVEDQFAHPIGLGQIQKAMDHIRKTRDVPTEEEVNALMARYTDETHQAVMRVVPGTNIHMPTMEYTKWLERQVI